LSYGTGTDPEEAVVRPAVEGTRRVVEAAATAGVRRVVLTSAANTASPSSYQTEGVSDETLWTDPDDPTLIPYRRAKTLAERTAWELADRQGAPELVTVLPGAVFGPVLTASAAGSVDIIARMLTGKMPRVPRIGLEVVDVRDLVDLHLRAMLHPDAAGQRFLGTGEFVWMRDIAQALKSGLGSQAGRVSTRGVPDFAVRLAARRNPALREIAPGLGRKSRHSTAKAERILGWQRRPWQETRRRLWPGTDRIWSHPTLIGPVVVLSGVARVWKPPPRFRVSAGSSDRPLSGWLEA
jgi:dihydroflavonol-4-reductase